MTVTHCRRCLLFEHNAELALTIREYVEALPDELRVSEDIYQNRLHCCRRCENLINGMCSLCGCFVEARAAKKFTHCAKSAEVW